MKIEKRYGYLVIDDNFYKVDTRDGQPVFKRVSKAKINRKLKKSEKLAEKLKEDLDKKVVLTETLMNLSEKDLDKLYRMVFKSKRKYKPRTRKDHCVDLKVGNFILPIVE